MGNAIASGIANYDPSPLTDICDKPNGFHIRLIQLKL